MHKKSMINRIPGVNAIRCKANQFRKKTVLKTAGIAAGTAIITIAGVECGKHFIPKMINCNNDDFDNINDSMSLKIEVIDQVSRDLVEEIKDSTENLTDEDGSEEIQNHLDAIEQIAKKLEEARTELLKAQKLKGWNKV